MTAVPRYDMLMKPELAVRTSFHAEDTDCDKDVAEIYVSSNDGKPLIVFKDVSDDEILRLNIKGSMPKDPDIATKLFKNNKSRFGHSKKKLAANKLKSVRISKNKEISSVAVKEKDLKKGKI